MLSLRLTAKDIALVTCFTALYAVFYSLPMFPIIGLSGAAITAAAIMAPVTGMLLGPLLGTLSALLGGVAVFFVGHFSPLSLVATSIAAFCAGLLYIGKRKLCALIYFLLLISFGFYPQVGPFWLYPLLTWFQVTVFLILLSPLYPVAFRKLRSFTDGKAMFPSFFIISLIATLAGQIAGSLTFEIMFWPAFIREVDAWTMIWKLVTWIYPVERIITALSSTIIGIPLFKALKTANLI
ncbi:MAG: hypothetical protein J7K49_06160 [Thaumarchaeota archaeon]|nr:hypothetical protein [Nitrososphaerota archaeon]